MTAWIPTIVAIVTAAIGSQQQVITDWLAAHPSITMILSAIFVIWGNLHPSPVRPKS